MPLAPRRLADPTPEKLPGSPAPAGHGGLAARLARGAAAGGPGPGGAPEPGGGSPSAGGRVEQLAVNLADLDRVEPLVRGSMLHGKLDLAGAVLVDRNRPDENAVAFTCSLLTAASICDILRGHDKKAGDAPTRVYINRGRGWARLPGGAVLSVVRNGNVVLNPDVFTVELVPLTPPGEARTVTGGQSLL